MCKNLHMHNKFNLQSKRGQNLFISKRGENGKEGGLGGGGRTGKHYDHLLYKLGIALCKGNSQLDLLIKDTYHELHNGATSNQSLAPEIRICI